MLDSGVITAVASCVMGGIYVLNYIKANPNGKMANFFGSIGGFFKFLPVIVLSFFKFVALPAVTLLLPLIFFIVFREQAASGDVLTRWEVADMISSMFIVTIFMISWYIEFRLDVFHRKLSSNSENGQ